MAVSLPAGPPPDRLALHNAALAYLARFAASETGLLRVLERRIARWSRAARNEGQDTEIVNAAASAARAAAQQVVARCVELNLINDAVFAESRARSLARSGRSQRAIAAHLAAKGIASSRLAPADAQTELASALIHARRRRIGPFATGLTDTMRDLARMARAGFSHDAARRALQMGRDEAEAIIHAMRSEP
jgi:regulatory protein